jgi:Leucine-rich repeat (LRR) protein
MSPLSSLKKLKTLKLLGKIEKISGLENSKDLECLDLSFNRIESLKGLENNINLKGLDIGNNRLKEVKANHLIHLEQILLSDNLLTFLKAKDMPPNIRSIDLRHAQYGMENYIEIDDLTILPYLIDFDCKDSNFGQYDCVYPDDMPDEHMYAIERELQRRYYEAQKAEYFYNKQYNDKYRSPLLDLPVEELRKKVTSGEIKSENGQMACGKITFHGNLVPFATKNPPAKY